MNIFISKELEGEYKSSPLVLVDVGSSGGLGKNWNDAKKFLKVVGFEADERSCGELMTDYEFTNLEYGLFNKKGDVNFYLTRAKTNSSLLEPNKEFLSKFPKTDRHEVIGEKLIKCDTLDSQLAKNGIKDVDFIKLDTQGSELYILEGAREILSSSVFGLEIETEFAPLYKNQPLFSDIDGFIRKFDFQLFDLAPCYWKRKIGKTLGGPQGQLIFADALYLKKTEAFRQIIEATTPEGMRKSKVLRAMSICFLYGYFDYALEIFEVFIKLFNQLEIGEIRHYFDSRRQEFRGGLNFKAREFFSSFFHRLSRLLKPSDYGWRRYRFKPGNLGDEFIIM